MVNRYMVNLTLTSVLAMTFVVSATGAFGQDLDRDLAALAKNAQKCDWEEVNFDFNSYKLTDAYPSLKLLAEVLKNNPSYKVTLEGHADGVGAGQYNQDLGKHRAQRVHDHLVELGVPDGQILVVSKGKTAHKVDREKPNYSPTDEARWVNRRVAISVKDGAKDITPCNATPNPFPDPKPAMADCCDVVKKILDEVLKLREQLATVQKQLHDDHEIIKKLIQDKMNGTAGTPGAPGTPGGPGGSGTG